MKDKPKKKNKLPMTEINPDTEVVVQKAWLRELLDYAGRLEAVELKGEMRAEVSLSSLLGYISSANYILEN